MIIDEIMKMNISTLISKHLKGQLDPLRDVTFFNKEGQLDPPVCDVRFFNQEGQLDLQSLSNPSRAPKAQSETLRKPQNVPAQ